MDVIIDQIYPNSQCAVVLTDTNVIFAVNLWDVKGYKREWDGYHTNKYIPV